MSSIITGYSYKRVAITGADSFLGSLIFDLLKRSGANVTPIFGDVRDTETFSDLDYKYDYLFHFAAPSSQVLFKQKPLYCADVTINGFLNAARFCEKHGIKLVYPSTGLLSSKSPLNEYARCKKVCEDIHLNQKLNAIGIRIFATYGPNESRKRDYASVPYLFARDMVIGRSPVIFGNGAQSRDFVYQDDVANAVAILAEETNQPIVDIGSGVSTDFNTLVKLINEALFGEDTERFMVPAYVNKPGDYVDKTVGDVNYLHSLYTPKVELAQGIKNIVASLQTHAA